VVYPQIEKTMKKLNAVIALALTFGVGTVFRRRFGIGTIWMLLTSTN